MRGVRLEFALIGHDDLGAIGREFHGVRMKSHFDRAQDAAIAQVEEGQAATGTNAVGGNDGRDAEAAARGIRGDTAHGERRIEAKNRIEICHGTGSGE